MTFPRIAIHTGNTVDTDNKHTKWFGTVVIQHNETTATVLKHGPGMSRKAKLRHPLLATFQSSCEATYWGGYTGQDFLGLEVVEGQIVPPNTNITVLEQLRPFGQAEQ